MTDREGFNTSADVQQFGVALASIAAAHSRDLDKFTVNVWYRALRDVPLDRLQQATVLLVNGEFFPKPLEWREAVDTLIAAEADAYRLSPPTDVPQLVAGPVTPAEPYFDCNVCEDTCWELMVCDAGTREAIYPKAPDRVRYRLTCECGSSIDEDRDIGTPEPLMPCSAGCGRETPMLVAGTQAIAGQFDHTKPRLMWCGRRDGECRPGHTFVKRCACYPTNPTWRRRNPPVQERYAKRGRRERGELRGQKE